MTKIYFCRECGKTSDTVSGPGHQKGWDVSCAMHATPIDTTHLIRDKEGIVLQVLDDPIRAQDVDS